MLQRFLTQDDERTPNTKPRRASDDADDGLGSIMVRCCRAGLKQAHWHHCQKTIKKVILFCIVQGEVKKGDIRSKSDIKWCLNKQVSEGMQARMKKQGKLDAFVVPRCDIVVCV